MSGLSGVSLVKRALVNACPAWLCAVPRAWLCAVPGLAVAPSRAWPSAVPGRGCAPFPGLAAPRPSWPR